MATPFVPLPLQVDWTGAHRFWAKKECKPLATGGVPSVRAVRAWAKTSVFFWRRPRGDMPDAPPTPVENESRIKDSWVERPITPTLLGYEILEERAKFTVYKIHVTTSKGDSWVIFRRYTDFCRLNEKLKELYPGFALALPPKRWFKDNYDEEFLDERLSGLQNFLQSVTLNKAVVRSEAVRLFLCLVDPPGPFDSLVESRAFCETLEETNHRLQRELLDSQKEAEALKKKLEEKENRYSLLMNNAKSLTLSSVKLEDPLTETLTTITNTHKEDETDVDQSEEVHTNESEVLDNDREMLISDFIQESNHDVGSYIYPLCYWY